MPAWPHSVTFDVDDEKGVAVWYLRDEGEMTSSGLVVHLSHSSGDWYEVASLITRESQTEATIHGTRVFFSGPADSRNAAWASDCVSYGAAYLDPDVAVADADELLTQAIAAGLD